MKNIRSSYNVVAVLACVLFFASGCGRSAEKGEVLVSIGDSAITVEDFNERIANLLALYDADLALEDDQNMSALSYAIKNNHDEIAIMLLREGAPIEFEKLLIVSLAKDYPKAEFHLKRIRTVALFDQGLVILRNIERCREDITECF